MKYREHHQKVYFVPSIDSRTTNSVCCCFSWRLPFWSSRRCATLLRKNQTKPSYAFGQSRMYYCTIYSIFTSLEKIEQFSKLSSSCPSNHVKNFSLIYLSSSQTELCFWFLQIRPICLGPTKNVNILSQRLPMTTTSKKLLLTNFSVF